MFLFRDIPNWWPLRSLRRRWRTRISDGMPVIHESTFSADLTRLLLQINSDWMKLHILNHKYVTLFVIWFYKLFAVSYSLYCFNLPFCGRIPDKLTEPKGWSFRHKVWILTSVQSWLSYVLHCFINMSVIIVLSFPAYYGVYV